MEYRKWISIHGGRVQRPGSCHHRKGKNGLFVRRGLPGKKKKIATLESGKGKLTLKRRGALAAELVQNGPVQLHKGLIKRFKLKSTTKKSGRNRLSSSS